MQRSRGTFLVLALVFLLIAAANIAYFSRDRRDPAVLSPTTTALAEQAPASATADVTAAVPPAATVMVTPEALRPSDAPTAVIASPVKASATSIPQTPPSATAAAAGGESGVASIASLNEVILGRRDAPELALAFGRTAELKRAARTTPLDAQIGSRSEFFVLDIDTDRYYTTTATLHFALDHVLMYVEDGIEFEQAALEQSARDFNNRIYPRNREVFGEEPSPGVDGDPRITIFNGRLTPGVGGFFSGNDAVPREVNRYSNEREMFYMNVEVLPLGSDSYISVLAHEFQHMIEWPQASQDAIWFNEGLSQLAEDLNGFPDSARQHVPSYLAMPDIQLTDWADDPSEALGHYGAAYLFVSYFFQHYGQAADLRQLIREGAGERLDLLAADAREVRGDVDIFDELFADWTVANLLNQPGLDGGRWSYRALPETVPLELTVESAMRGDVAQYGADYLDLGRANGDRVFHFDGSEEVGVVAAESDGVAWWSNRADDAVSYLTRRFDLSGQESATLQFRLWHDLEEDYDYGFVSASTDDGKTWTTLQGRHTTTDNPQGTNYGHGYTSTSGAETATWVDESIDLSAYSGKQVMIRFMVITDDAFNRPGMMVDDIRIPEIAFVDNAEQASDGWEAAGWVRTDNRLEQRWQLRLVHVGGGQIQVEPVTVDERGRAEITLPDDARGVLVVSGTTPHTSERASYTITPAAASVSGGDRLRAH